MPDILYYDGQCPLCTREMAKLGQLCDGELQLQDIHGLTSETELPDRDTLLRTLHLKTADGQLLTGIDANVMAWQHTRFGPLWRWLQWPVIRPVAEAAYRFWAQRRFRRLYGS
ncbi:MAG: DUF393 domain-containing protein [Haliea sp.]|jgi:predicted DCC family thiol-disulfide oxidoreductase YuxK|nr:DUF393 domain-containing protein [Haliea sp.]MDP4917416.1 DUF393 domain-containing protein [Haliea sp.]MDP5064515.1 DUF393 domain-containing protein [Haliea sp.]